MNDKYERKALSNNPGQFRDRYDEDDVLIEARVPTSTDPDDFLTGHLLVAMPQMNDPRFEHAVVYLCAHNASGAMGLTLNKSHETVSIESMFEQLDIESLINWNNEPQKNLVINGGPVETSRGFVLHTLDYTHDSTIEVTNKIGLTASVDILKAINAGNGPADYLITLGFSAWSSGQLEDEFNENAWLSVEADNNILFNMDRSKMWTASIAKLGVDPGRLHDTMGNT